MLDLLWLPGTGEIVGPTSPSGVFLDAIDTTKVNITQVKYLQEYGDPQPYNISRQQGYTNLLLAVKNAKNPVVCGGYSQGAGIAGDLVRDLSTQPGPRPLGTLLAGVALMADPGRPPVRQSGQALVGADPGGFGISGARAGTYACPAIWAAAVGDGITALPAGDPLRTVADLTGWYSIASPADAIRWGEDMVAVVRARRLQRWWSLDNWRGWGGALGYLDGYLTGAHTDAYLRQGLCKLLADAVNGLASEPSSVAS